MPPSRGHKFTKTSFPLPGCGLRLGKRSVLQLDTIGIHLSGIATSLVGFDPLDPNVVGSGDVVGLNLDAAAMVVASGGHVVGRDRKSPGRHVTAPASEMATASPASSSFSSSTFP